MRRFVQALACLMVLLAPAAVDAAVSKKKPVAKTKVAASKRNRKAVPVDNWKEPSFADSSLGDNIEGEDLVVRKAAVDALGPFNGSIVVSDPPKRTRPYNRQSKTRIARRIPALFHH